MAKRKRFTESLDSFKPRLPRGMKDYQETRPTPNAKPTTDRGMRRAERNGKAR